MHELISTRDVNPGLPALQILGRTRARGLSLLAGGHPEICRMGKHSALHAFAAYMHLVKGGGKRVSYPVEGMRFCRRQFSGELTLEVVRESPTCLLLHSRECPSDRIIRCQDVVYRVALVLVSCVVDTRRPSVVLYDVAQDYLHQALGSGPGDSGHHIFANRVIFGYLNVRALLEGI